jgi:glutathione S-transferase
MSVVLYHCEGARSLRPLWVLEEMGLDYEVKKLPFPPRVLQRDYLEINPLGTVPYMIDGDVRMTESAGICHYLVETYGPTPLSVSKSEPDYGAYLNWLYYSDATITFPQTIFLRYTSLEPEERRLPQAAEDYRRFFAGRLRAVEAALGEREFLCGGRFTIADVCVGYALHLASSLQLADCFGPCAAGYWERMKAIPSYERAVSR